MTRNERSILTVTIVGHALCHWSVLTFSGLLATMRIEFSLPPFWVTALPFIGYVLMGVGAVPAGMLTDRWQARGMLSVYFLLTGLACTGAALAQSAVSLAVALTALGAAVSLYHPVGLALISHGCERRGRALGIHGVAGSVGLLGAPYGLWMASMGTWRLGYFAIAAVAFLGAAATYFLPIRETVHRPPSTTERFVRTPIAPNVVKLLVLLYAAMMLSGFNYRALMTALPHYVSGAAADPSQAAWGKALVVLLVGGLGQYLAGRFSDRVSPVRLYVTLAAASVPTALLFGLSGGLGTPAMAAGMVLMLFHFGTQPVENLLIAKHTPASLRSTSYGIKFALTFGVGALGAIAAGWVWDKTGSMAAVFYLFAAVATGVTAMVVALVRVAARQERSEATTETPPAETIPVAPKQV